MRVRPYLCPACGGSYPITDLRWRCDCGSHLNLADPPPLDLGRIRSDLTLWRYRDLLTLPAETEPLTLGEGMTPLVEVDWDGQRVSCKLDFMTPTGSFKDRGAAVLLAVLRGLGVSSVHEDSSGNGGAAMAAYARRAGLRCTIYTPASASGPKLVQIAFFGAELITVAGERGAARAAAEQERSDSFYAGHNWHPLFIEGVKTYAFEVWEQSGRRAPPAVIMPLGGGSSLLGAYAGFRSLLASGAIDRMPALFPVQPAECAPVFRAFQSGLDHVPPVAAGKTIAEGAAIAAPLRGKEILAAVRETSGRVLAVTEEQIVQALHQLARSGIYAEPTAALAAAGLSQLANEGLAGRLDGAVVYLTGSGLKATDAMKRLI